MKALKVIAWGIIATTSFVGAVELADKVENMGQGDCARVVTITDFSIWLSQHYWADIDYRDGTWFDVRENKVIGTSPAEDSDICLAEGVAWR